MLSSEQQKKCRWKLLVAVIKLIVSLRPTPQKQEHQEVLRAPREASSPAKLKQQCAYAA